MLRGAAILMAMTAVAVKLFLITSPLSKHEHSEESLKPPADISKHVKVGVHHLYVHTWAPVETQALKGVVVVSHGTGEHILRGGYEYLGDQMAKAGYAMVGFDHQGHGRSTGDRMYMERFQDYVDHYIAISSHASKQFPGVPVFAYGHSLGSLIAFEGASQRPELFRGSVVSGTAVYIDPEVATPTLRKIVGLLSDVLPKLPMDPLDSKSLSRNPEVAVAYDADPLIYHGGLPTRFISEFFVGIDSVMNHAKEFAMPLLMLHGGEDTLCQLQGANSVLQAVKRSPGYVEADLRVYEGFLHELYEDPERDLVVSDFIGWLDKHVAASTA